MGDDGEGDVEAIGGSASVDGAEGENGEADHGGDASVDDDRFVRLHLQERWVWMTMSYACKAAVGNRDQASQGRASTLRTRVLLSITIDHSL